MTYDGAPEDFDWRKHTTLAGTVSRLGQYVRGTCARCQETDALVYDTLDDPTLLCASCSRIRAFENPRVEVCDECGGDHAWRDPVTGKNEFYCATCHGKNGTIFQNRWANSARVGRVLGMHAKAKCTAAGYGTDCKGEIKPRGGEFKGRLLCNKHAGKTSVGPEGHQ